MARMQSVDAEAIKKPQERNSGSSMDAVSLTSQNAPPPTISASAEEDLRQTRRRSNWRLLGLCMFFLFYLAIGATVFEAIEGPLEQQELATLLEKKNDFMNTYHIPEEDLDNFMTEIVNANNRGVSIFKNNLSVPSWSFGQAFFFSSTVVTTIGYGHQSPLSTEGKVFCMLYALIGIPMTLILLSAVVERGLIPVNTGLEFLHRALGDKVQPIYIYMIHFSLLVGLIITAVFLIPAAIFASLESNWNYLDSLYYCFISLTTIGLGDFIPGDTPGQHLRPLYKACTTFYLLFGVTAMMLTLSVFYNIPKCDLKIFFLLRPDGCFGRSNGLTDPERMRLQPANSSGGAGGGGPKYTQHLEDPENEHRRVVRARSRPDEDD